MMSKRADPNSDKGVRNVRLEAGRDYAHRSNGSTYKCLAGGLEPSLQHVSVLSLDRCWTFTAHNVTMYADGSIDWDYSTDGHWEEARNE